MRTSHNSDTSQLCCGIVHYIFDTNSPAVQNVNRAKIDPEANKVADEFLQRIKEKHGISDPSTFFPDGGLHAWAVFDRVMPLALERNGEITADTLREAFLNLDYPANQDPRGWRAKLAPPDHEMAGQNLNSTGTLLQRLNGKEEVAWPKRAQTIVPKFPMPKDNPLAK